MLLDLVLISFSAFFAFYYSNHAFELMEKRKHKSAEEKKLLTKQSINFFIIATFFCILFALSLKLFYEIHLIYFISESLIAQFLSFLVAIYGIFAIVSIANFIPVKRKFTKTGKKRPY